MQAVLELAEKLGKLLAEDPRGKAYIQAVEDLNADAQAQQLLRDYETQARKIAELERQVKPVEVDDKTRLADLQAQIASNQLVKRFLQSQVEHLDMLRKVHQKINEQWEPPAK